MEFNFSFFDLFEYWDILKEYINPASTLFWGIVGGVIGFAIFLIVELLFRKKILVRRRHWSLKILSYLYMLFFPLYAGFCFTQWFAYNNVENQLVGNIQTYTEGVYELCDDHLKETIESMVHKRYLESSVNELIDEGAFYLTEVLAESFEDKDVAEGKQKGTFGKLRDRFVSYLYVNYLKKELMGKFTAYVDEKVMLQEGITEELLNVRIQDIIDTGLVEIIIEKHIRNIFGGLKMKAILMFVLGISLPLIEIIIANYLDRKAKKKEQLINQMN